MHHFLGFLVTEPSLADHLRLPGGGAGAPWNRVVGIRQM